MNKTLALSAFVMFAVVMGMSAISPAFAAANSEHADENGIKNSAENNAGGNSCDATDNDRNEASAKNQSQKNKDCEE